MVPFGTQCSGTLSQEHILHLGPQLREHMSPVVIERRVGWGDRSWKHVAETEEMPVQPAKPRLTHGDGGCIGGYEGIQAGDAITVFLGCVPSAAGVNTLQDGRERIPLQRPNVAHRLR